MRTLQAALLRAKIPIYYTEGFNPHPKMVFSLPIALGDESVCEFLDIRLNEPMEKEALLAAVNAQLTSDLRFTDAYSREGMGKSDFRDIAYACYRLTLRDTDLAAVKAVLEGATPLPCEKKSKKGQVTVDLRPNIREVREEGGGVFTLTLCAGEFNYVNPENLMKALREQTALPLDDYDILRFAVLREDGSEFS